jgi:hypothetical protein
MGTAAQHWRPLLIVHDAIRGATGAGAERTQIAQW